MLEVCFYIEDYFIIHINYIHITYKYVLYILLYYFYNNKYGDILKFC